MPGRLVDKIILFLTRELEHSTDEVERKNREEVIENIKESGGQCYGYSVLQAYGKKIEDENSKKGLTKTADDLSFFRATKEVLLNWNGIDQLDDSKRSDIERLISNILFYQRLDLNPSKNGKPAEFIINSPEQNFAEILEDTADRKFIKTYDSEEGENRVKEALYEPLTLPIKSLFEAAKGAVLSKKALQARLEKIVKKGTIVMVTSSIGSVLHGNAIYQSNDDEIYFFNNEEEKIAKDFKTLTTHLWDATNRYNFLHYNPALEKMSDHHLRKIHEFKVYQLLGEEKYNDYPCEIVIEPSEFKEFALTNFPGFNIYEELETDRDPLLKEMFNSLPRSDAFKIYNDPTVKEELLKTAMLSKTQSVLSEKFSPSIVALPPLVMTKEMLQERLKKLDSEKIGSVAITYQVNGGYNSASIERGYSSDNDKPLTLFMPTSNSEITPSQTFATLDCAADEIWNKSAPGNFRNGFGFKAAEACLRRIGLYVFESDKNEEAVEVIKDPAFLQPQPKELQQLGNDLKGAFKSSNLFKKDPLVLDFLAQFRKTEQSISDMKEKTNISTNDEYGGGERKSYEKEIKKNEDSISTAQYKSENIEDCKSKGEEKESEIGSNIQQNDYTKDGEKNYTTIIPETTIQGRSLLKRLIDCISCVPRRR